LLIADDHPASRCLLEVTLQRWGHTVEVAADGLAAWQALSRPDPPPLAILDWTMPGLEGPEICRRLRALNPPRPPYVILLTARGDRADVVAGLEAGADDYLVKPFDQAELRARVNVGLRVVGLQRSLSNRVAELEKLLARVRQLQGLLPICSYCKRIRSDDNYWQRVEEYIAAHTDARFTHGICPHCLADLAAELGVPADDPELTGPTDPPPPLS
jgi:CheY-like chemotaxis protein